MIERGAFRSIYCALVDGPDFQAFSPGAKLVFYTLKMTLGPSGIDVVPALVATLEERTGADANQVEKGLAQLIEKKWVERDRNVVWIVDALRYEPAFSLENQNHRAKIRRHLDGLPKLPIVDRFRAYYGIAAPPADLPADIPSNMGTSGRAEDPSAPPKKGSKMPSKKASKIPSKIREEGEGKTEEGAGKTEKGDSAARRRRGGDGHTSRAGRPTWLTPFADAWRARNGGTMSAGKAVKALADLVEEYGADETLRRWVIYLAAKGEYANAPKFAETWGLWDKPQLRHERGASSTAPAPNAAQVEAGNLVAAIRELITDNPIPGQGSRRLLRNADVERMGDDVFRAYRTVGGAQRFLAIDVKADDLPFLIRAFSDALQVARSSAAPPADTSTDEAQSA
jgi:hypothetical protein